MAELAAPCARCLETGEALDRAPLSGPLGERVQREICRRCWREWGEMEVRVINELRLNFMDPEAQEVLERHLRDFLCLPAAGEE
ncbi:MAG TPA: Fe(2+)-trafficking protein [Thermoanaerobaculia bacterium]|nr:Fe(2+)-trafficking protein [Thermoanaerobaculia bacterium]